MESVLTIGLSPAFQKIIIFNDLKENEVNRSSRHTLECSGKAINVSRVLANLGRPSLDLLQLGGPRTNEFISLCNKEGIITKHIDVKAEVRTCTTVINEAKHTSTELIEEAEEVEESASDAFFNLFLSEIDNHSAVVISGTKAKGFKPTLLPSIVKESKKRNKLVVLDIKGNDLKSCLECSPDIIKPNLSEFCSTFAIKERVLESEENLDLLDIVKEATKEIFDKYRTKSIITRGKYDTWCYDGNRFFTVPTKDIKVVNTIGCGDTLTAALTHSLLNGDDLETAVAFGMYCAQEKAMQLGHGIKV